MLLVGFVVVFIMAVALLVDFIKFQLDKDHILQQLTIIECQNIYRELNNGDIAEMFQVNINELLNRTN